jgi:hypothetical protein
MQKNNQKIITGLLIGECLLATLYTWLVGESWLSGILISLFGVISVWEYVSLKITGKTVSKRYELSSKKTGMSVILAILLSLLFAHLTI